MNSIIELDNTNKGSTFPVWEDVPNGYRCHVCFIREADNTYSAVVVNLPGCGSCGDSEEVALENVKEAIRGVIESYSDAGEDIPWVDVDREEKPDGTVRCKWIVVNV